MATVKFSNVDGKLVKYEVVQGPATVMDNYPDQDAIDIEFSNAGGLRKAIQSARARKDAKSKTKNELRSAKAKATGVKAKAKLTQAQSQVEAAKSLGKTDPNDAAMANALAGDKPSGMSTGMIIGISAAGLLLVGVVAYFIIKKKKK